LAVPSSPADFYACPARSCQLEEVALVLLGAAPVLPEVVAVPVLPEVVAVPVYFPVALLA